MAINILLKELLEAGCHFGHQSQRWNPKATSFIYSKKQGIHIIDLVKTKKGIENACEFIIETLGKGGEIVFVGTKRQAKVIVKNEALRCGAMYIVERWPGGLLTNYEILKKNLKKMKDLKEKTKNKDLQKGYTKKEVSDWEKELLKLDNLYGGIADLNKIPDILFIIDIKKEESVIKEAKKTNVAVIGITDTNSDPTKADYCIPANDDAVGSIKIIVKYIADAVMEGKKLWEKKKGETEGQKLETKSADKEKSETEKLTPKSGKNSLKTKG